MPDRHLYADGEDAPNPAAYAEAITLEDVARAAGVNKVTASVVLSGGSGNTRVSDATRQRILAIAARLNYRPNAVAQSLRRRRSNTIGLYCGGVVDTRNPFLAEIVAGLYRGCADHGRDFLLNGTIRGDSPDQVVAELLNGRVDGLVVHADSADPIIGRLKSAHLPVVTIANAEPGLASVTVDEACGAALIADHLAERGHRSVLYAGSPYPLAALQRRRSAFEAAADIHQMTVTSVVASQLPDGYAAVAAAIGQNIERPTVIVCWNDETAYGIVQHLRSLGIAVPGEIAVVGFDGWATAIPPVYRVTTIRAPWYDVARSAAALLADRRDKPPPVDHPFPVELLIGDTT